MNFPQQLVQLLEDKMHLNATIDVYGYPGASPSFMRACHSTLMRTDAAHLYVIEMTDNLSDGYDGVGKSVEGLMSAVRQRAPARAAAVDAGAVDARHVPPRKRVRARDVVPRVRRREQRGDRYDHHAQVVRARGARARAAARRARAHRRVCRHAQPPPPPRSRPRPRLSPAMLCLGLLARRRAPRKHSRRGRALALTLQLRVRTRAARAAHRRSRCTRRASPEYPRWSAPTRRPASTAT